MVYPMSPRRPGRAPGEEGTLERPCIKLILLRFKIEVSLWWNTFLHAPYKLDALIGTGVDPGHWVIKFYHKHAPPRRLQQCLGLNGKDLAQSAERLQVVACDYVLRRCTGPSRWRDGWPPAAQLGSLVSRPLSRRSKRLRWAAS